MAKKPDLTKLSLTELKVLAGDVQKAIESFQAKQRKDALAAAKAAAKEHGFKLEELTGGAPKKSKATIPPKYRHPENPERTWTGRGRQPVWIKEALADGKSLEDFRI